MLLMLHILIALTSVIFTGITYLRPTQNKFNGSYGLIAATLISGTVLVVQTGSPLLKSCLTGLLYLGVVLTGTVVAHYKVRNQELDD
jgi:hypothetical protein